MIPTLIFMTFLTGVLFTWLEHLKVPVLDKEYLTYIVLAPGKIDYCFTKQDKVRGYTYMSVMVGL